MSELKPCPFCSAEPEVLSDGRRTWGLVQHEDWCFFPNFRQHEISESDFAAWNTRHQCGLTDEDYSILLDELGVSERTCKFVSSKGSDYPPVCSACGYELGIYDCEWFDDGTYGYERNYCPNCGAKVVGE